MNEWITKHKTGLIIGVLIILILGLIAFQTQTTNSDLNLDCCDRICGSVGLKCESIFNKEVTCSLNYEKYSRPEIAELFRFKVIDEAKACAVTPVE